MGSDVGLDGGTRLGKDHGFSEVVLERERIRGIASRVAIHQVRPPLGCGGLTPPLNSLQLGRPTNPLLSRMPAASSKSLRHPCGLASFDSICQLWQTRQQHGQGVCP